MGCVSFGEAAGPGGVGADGGVAGRMEVAVACLFVAFFMAEEDAGLCAGGPLVKEIASGCEVLGAGVQIAAEERSRPGCWNGLGLVRHNTVAGFL